jgi:valyl-tRNA synthetase
VIGNLDDSFKLEMKIEKWAKEIGADLVTAVGREGWWDHRLPGWKKQGAIYSKDI